MDYNTRNTIYINESGLYCLIFGRKKRESIIVEKLGHIRGIALYQEARCIRDASRNHRANPQPNGRDEAALQ
ncbi:MAG: hypothetical protein ACKPKO_24905, partial [Candidatus Fonsibacter sp.]